MKLFPQKHTKKTQPPPTAQYYIPLGDIHIAITSQLTKITLPPSARPSNTIPICTPLTSEHSKSRRNNPPTLPLPLTPQHPPPKPLLTLKLPTTPPTHQHHHSKSPSRLKYTHDPSPHTLCSSNNLPLHMHKTKHPNTIQFPPPHTPKNLYTSPLHTPLTPLDTLPTTHQHHIPNKPPSNSPQITRTPTSPFNITHHSPQPRNNSRLRNQPHPTPHHVTIPLQPLQHTTHSNQNPTTTYLYNHR